MKKVLFITYYWPPSGKASLHWPLKMIKYLPKFGWQPLVLTVKEDTFSQKDKTNFSEISDDLIVSRAKSFEPFNIYKKFTGKSKSDQLIAAETISQSNKKISHKISIWLRMNLFIPDARIGWYFPAVNAGRNLLKDVNVDVIVTVGPPHSTHLIGKKLSKKFKIPHVPVFIDPWVDIIYYKNFTRNRITLAIDNYLEKSVVKNSNALIFVTETMKNDYIKKYNDIETKSNVLYWGYDEEDFEKIVIRKKKTDDKLIVHAGNIFSYQNPENLWKQIKKEILEGHKTKIRFIGTVAPEVKRSISDNDLDQITEYCGFLPYYEMLKYICEADILLVCVTEPRHVPGKLFEYLRTGNPVIAFGDENTEVKNILNKSNAGMIFDHKEPVKKFFTLYNTFSPDMSYIQKFDREKIAIQLSEFLNSI